MMQQDDAVAVKRMTWRGWRRYFEERAGRPIPALEADHDYQYLPRSLARSIAVFQLGESGGGSVVQQAQESQLPGVTADYAAAVGGFVAEEHRHANLLAMCVRLMGGELIRENWTARWFVRGRRLLGLRLKIMVLLAAEVIGTVFYRLIAERLPPGSMQRWLTDIRGDEQAHLDFHCAFLRSQMNNRTARLVFTAAWRTLMLGTACVVLIDHRRTFLDLHIERGQVWRAMKYMSRAAEKQVLERPTAANSTATADCRTG